MSTDDVSVSIGFIKTSVTHHPPPLQQAVHGVLSPLSARPINLQCPPRIVGLDPGRISILTAAIHSQQAADTLKSAVPTQYETVQWTGGRWYEASMAISRTAKARKWLRQDRPVRQAILSMPSAKTASTQSYLSYVTPRLLSQHILLQEDVLPCGGVIY